MTRVLITRAAPEAEATASRVARMGHTPIVSPALVIEALPFQFDPNGVQALLFTSAAGVRALGKRDLPALAVGEGTAEAARALGYQDVRSADGAAVDLIELAKGLDPRRGAMVHVSGEDIATNVAEAITDAGFAAARLIVYRARAATALTPQALNLLTGVSPGDSVMFHSARGAESFCRLAAAAGMHSQAARLIALCLGGRSAETAAAFDFRRILVASAPREKALLSLLEKVAADRA
ncbi:MAG TPA: uroporphyrinogen-III synthase [Caulobacterales bacterium]|jgi:uroporphyrinogen-III synthase|nr:uroporphyrinogen-III synthase [Caulobacterales bacterium]